MHSCKTSMEFENFVKIWMHHYKSLSSGLYSELKSMWMKILKHHFWKEIVDFINGNH